MRLKTLPAALVATLLAACGSVPAERGDAATAGVAWVARAVVTTPVAMPLAAASSHKVANGASRAPPQSP